MEKVLVELYFKFISTSPPSLRLVLLPKRINALESYIALIKLELLFELVKSKKVPKGEREEEVNFVLWVTPLNMGLFFSNYMFLYKIYPPFKLAPFSSPFVGSKHTA